MKAIVSPHALLANGLIASCARIAVIPLVSCPAITLPLSINAVSTIIAGPIVCHWNLFEGQLTVTIITCKHKSTVSRMSCNDCLQTYATGVAFC